ncbi:fructose-1,6-bisphosphatase class 2 [Oxobacter pfennigii]|uniref:Fructose-1,6-bisphosphatase n=1 Tax=Oxobacter pfennigii TaxID=36849 RepID=A0A0N8NT93_9CLOT|nr:class II fructose-bisphosphatase [Oxobacter pfennigii]KPU44192.1 fructose-1,6-bisphosphatase class 2 [Oxobacter pfennigii]
MLYTDLSMGIVRVTELAALSCAKYMGRGDKDLAFRAAVEGLRSAMIKLPIKGTVVVTESSADGDYILNKGDKLGVWKDDMPEYDIAVDPLDGAVLIAKGLPNAMSVIAVGPKGSLFKAPDVYMQKIVAGPEARGVIDINKSIDENIKNVAKALDKDISELTVIIQDRPRHEKLIRDARAAGARVKLFGEGDVAAALAALFDDTGVDLFVGTGGASEGVIAAAAVKCLGGHMQAKFLPKDDKEKDELSKLGIDNVDSVLTVDDLVKTQDVFFAATGITDCDLLKGVVYHENEMATTNSVVLRSKTGSIRFVEARHAIKKSTVNVFVKR